MSNYQGLPHQQPAALYYDGLEVDMRPPNAVAGLEAVPPPDHSGPEVAYSDVAKQQPDHALPQAVNHSSDQKHLASEHGAYLNADPVSSPGPSPQAGSGQYSKLEHNGLKQAAATTPKKRKIWIMVGVIVALLVVAAVVGGVVGSRATSKLTSTPTTSTSSPAVGLKNILPNSRMAATGWREGSTYHLRLYYQGPDQMLRYSNFTSGAPNWTGPVLLDGLRTSPRANTSLAAAVDIGSTTNPGLKLYYLDDAGMIRNQNWDHLSPEAQGSNGTDGKWDPGPVALTSRLSSYWPYLLAQDSNSVLHWWRYADRWEDSNLTIRAPARSPFVAVPAMASYVDAGAFIYRRSGGDLYNYFADRKGANDGISWANGDLSRFSIPDTSALGAFVTARTDTTGDDNINTHIVYQDDAGALQMVWQNRDSDWQGPKTFDAFQGADKGTDIACITAAAWNASDVHITSAYDVSRCYFQVKGQVRETHWTGNDWNDLGFIPIK